MGSSVAGSLRLNTIFLCLTTGRLHKSEPNLRIKLEEEAFHSKCSLMEAQSMSDCLRVSMQVQSDHPRSLRDVFAGPLSHANKDFGLTAFREPQPQSALPPLPRLVKLEQPSPDQRLLDHAQSVCQMSGLMAPDIKRETGFQSDHFGATRFAQGFQECSFAPFGGVADSWLLGGDWESSHSTMAAVKDVPSMFDPLRPFSTMTCPELDSGSSDDKDSGLGDELESYAQNRVRKDDLAWSSIPSMSTQDTAKRVKSTAERTTAKWQSIIRKVPGHRTTFKSGRPRLCQFLLELLEDPEKYSYMIEWLDQERGVFKFVQSGEVARMWGRRRNKPQMKYENFARSLRTYIAKGILTKPRSKLVYRFAKVKN